MVPVRSELGSEYSSAPRPAAAAPARPQLVLCDVSASAAAPVRRRRRSVWQRSLLSLAVVCAVLFLIATCASALWHNAVAAYASTIGAPAPTVAVHVGKGDTLWRYAARYGDPESYMPDRVQAIASANHLTLSQPLTPGQTLRIPVQNPIELARMQSSSHARMASRVLR